MKSWIILLYLMLLFLERIWKCPDTLICCCHPFYRSEGGSAVSRNSECLTQDPQMSHWACSLHTSVGVATTCFCSDSWLPVTWGPLCSHSLVRCGFLLIFVEWFILILSGILPDEIQLFSAEVCLCLWTLTLLLTWNAQALGGSGQVSKVVPRWMCHWVSCCLRG